MVSQGTHLLGGMMVGDCSDFVKVGLLQISTHAVFGLTRDLRSVAARCDYQET